MESFPQPSMLFSANVNPMLVYLVIRPKSDIRIMELLLITTFTYFSLLFIFYEPQLLRHIVCILHQCVLERSFYTHHNLYFKHTQIFSCLKTFQINSILSPTLYHKFTRFLIYYMSLLCAMLLYSLFTVGELYIHNLQI